MRTMITTYTQSLPTLVSQCDLSDLSYCFFSVTVIVTVNKNISLTLTVTVKVMKTI